jgi:lipopolysaccharide transport system permease protein
MEISVFSFKFWAHYSKNYAWPWANRNLIWQFARREVLGRYRGSIIGIGWSVLTPMAMLAVYTLVFRHIFKATWPGVQDGNMSFALNLFAGLLVFNWAAEFLSRAPRLVTEQPNLVTKVVFPLQVLPWSALMSSFFHVMVSCSVWLAGCLLFGQGLHASWLALPLVFLAFAPMLLGLGWALSALGAYFRDLSEIVGLVMGMLLFLTPVFFPLSVLPDFLQVWVQFNPLATPIEALRQIGLIGVWPNFSSLLQLFVAGLGMAFLGAWLFEKSRKGFADVL